MAGASRSAVMVTLVRAHLTWMGVVGDPYAIRMLPPKGRRVATAFRLPGLRRLAQHRTLPYLAARTLVFDWFVRDALDDGIRQVVIVGAGFDSQARSQSRAWPSTSRSSRWPTCWRSSRGSATTAAASR